MGQDVLVGGPGDDTYVIGDAADTIVETRTGGDDTVLAATSYALPPSWRRCASPAPRRPSVSATTSQHVDLARVGCRALRLKGNDTLEGSPNSERLDGGPGADLMIGNGGFDAFIVDSVSDVVRGTSGSVNASVSFALPDGLSSLYGVGSARKLVGNDGTTRSTGRTATTSLPARQGLDTLFGLGGADEIDGGPDGDFIYGGKGNDRLTGGGGADRFKFTDADFGRDVVTDFRPDERDVVSFLAKDFATPSAALQAVRYKDGDAIWNFADGRQVVLGKRHQPHGRRHRHRLKRRLPGRQSGSRLVPRTDRPAPPDHPGDEAGPVEQSAPGGVQHVEAAGVGAEGGSTQR